VSSANFLYLSKDIKDVRYSTLFELLWYSETLTPDLVFERSDGRFYPSKGWLDEFKSYVEKEINSYFIENLYNFRYESTEALLDIAFNILRVISENKLNKDAANFYDMVLNGKHIGSTLRSEIADDRLPMPSTLDNYEKIIKTQAKNKYTKVALKSIELFRNEWRSNYIKHIGQFAHDELEWRIIDFLRNLFGEEICTYECRLESYKKPSGKESRRIADLLLKRTEKFKKLIEKNQHILSIPSGVRELNIDFAMLSTKDETDPFIIEKVAKEGYNSPTRHLITVIYGYDPTSASDLQRIEDLKKTYERDSSGQAQVITLDELLSFLSIKITNSFSNLETDVRKARSSYKSKYYDSLKSLADSAKVELKALNLPHKIEKFQNWQKLISRSEANLLNYLPQKDL